MGGGVVSPLGPELTAVGVGKCLGGRFPKNAQVYLMDVKQEIGSP